MRRAEPGVDLHVLPSQLSMMADDLAGACDTGLEFLDALGRVTVVVDSDRCPAAAAPLPGLVVWNTESRSLPVGEAVEKARKAARRASTPGMRVLLKKTDSAFRSHFGQELSAVMDELDLDLCVLSPAIPEFGRTTRDGVQYIDGVPISETYYSRDPKHPVTTSRVADIVGRGTSRPIRHLRLQALRGSGAVRHVRALLASGAQIIVTDGLTDGDLEATARVFLSAASRMMFVGGQGIGAALAGLCSGEVSRPAESPLPRGPVVVICGTLHPASRRQLAHLCRFLAAEPIRVEASGVGAGDREVERAARRVLAQTQRGGVGLLATPGQARRHPDAIEKLLASVAFEVSRRTPLAGLMLTGGTTAYTVCRRIGAGTLLLRGRVASGAILAQAPELAGTAIGIKGGSLGQADALTRFVQAVLSRAR